jgi:hypothetical protein
VSGVVLAVMHEPDDDVHVLLKLDPQYTKLLTPGNAAQGGNLVVEDVGRTLRLPVRVVESRGFPPPGGGRLSDGVPATAVPDGPDATVVVRATDHRRIDLDRS